MVCFVVGFILGILAMGFGVAALKVGTLKIDQISAEKDLYRFEIDNLDGLSHRKYILLKVDPNADLSHE